MECGKWKAMWFVRAVRYVEQLFVKGFAVNPARGPSSEQINFPKTLPRHFDSGGVASIVAMWMSRRLMVRSLQAVYGKSAR